MAAGLGFKTFTTGEVLTAANVNGYLMQGILVFASAAARDAAITSPQEGQACYLKDTDSVLTYSGSAWVAVGGSSGANWSLLNSGGTALTGAQTVTVSGISGKDKIMVIVDSASSASAGSLITVRLNADTGSNYYQFGENAYYPSTYAASNFDILAGAQPYIRLAKTSGNASSAVAGYVLLSGCNSAGVKVFNSIGGASAATSNNHESWKLGGYYNSASTISSVSVFSATGDLDAGTVYVYTSA